MTQIKIDKGVPAPNEHWSRNRVKYPFKSMEVGDSFFTETSRVAVTSAACGYARRNGVKFTTRSENGGTRVWRIA
jgi:hypothetical protein